MHVVHVLVHVHIVHVHVHVHVVHVHVHVHVVHVHPFTIKLTASTRKSPSLSSSSRSFSRKSVLGGGAGGL